MSLKKHLLLCGLLCLAGLSVLPAYDWGGSLKNTSTGTINTDDATYTFVQEEQLDAWISLNFSNTVSFFLKGNGKLAIPADGSAVEPGGNLESFFLSLAIPQAFGPQTQQDFKIGRFSRADMQGIVLNHILDGIRSQTNLPGFAVTLDVATSLLQFKQNSTIFLSHADYADFADDTVLLAAPRLFADLELDFPRLLSGQTLTVAALSQLDLRPDLASAGDTLTAANTTGGASNYLYGGLALKGALAPPLFYSLYGYIGTGTMVVSDGTYQAGSLMRSVDLLSGLGGLDLRLFIREALNSTLSLSTTLGSWDTDALQGTPESDTDGSFGGFIPFSARAPHLIFNPGLNNMWETSLSYSIKPDQAFQLGLSGTAFVRPAVLPVSSAVSLVGGSQELYLGSEAALTATLRFTSELGLLIQAAGFFPNTLAVDNPLDVLLKGQFTISF